FLLSLSDATSIDTSTLSLHDALPIWKPSHDALAQDPPRPRRRLRPRPPGPGARPPARRARPRRAGRAGGRERERRRAGGLERRRDRKSTRLNSSHVKTSYAVFCLKKK